MKQNFYKFLLALLFAFVCSLAIDAQTGGKDSKKMLAEITDFRQKLIQAIEKRDRKTLENLFAEDFTHTHAIGKVDGKLKRIEAILTGDKTLESVQPDEIAIRFYGENTAVVVGQTTIEDAIYRWTIVYVKTGGKWQIAASQATRLAEK
jgi:hypothetical protein